LRPFFVSPVVDVSLINSGPAGGDFWSLTKDSFLIVLGALIGFGVSWFFAWRAERDRQLDNGYSLFFRARDATEGVLALRKAITQNLSPEALSGIQYRWQLVQIPTGFIWQQNLAFEPGELSLLAKAGEFDLVNDLSEIARGHNILHIIAGEYAQRRERLTDQLRGRSKTTVQGTQIGSWITREDQEALAPDMMLVDDLLGQLIEKANDIATFSMPVMERLGPKIKEALKDERFRGRVTYGAPAATTENDPT
jgi:hypothetical protein